METIQAFPSLAAECTISPDRSCRGDDYHYDRRPGGEHLRHHAAYAGDEQVLLTDLGALPFCRGEAPADRITDTASIEE